MEEINFDEIISKLRYDMSFTNDYILNKHNFDDLCIEFRKMRKEYKQLKEKIDKAIKYSDDNLKELDNFKSNGVELSAVKREWQLIKQILGKGE